MSDVWYQIMNGLAAEFGDLLKWEQTTRMVIRLLLSVVIGGVLGYERERSGKAAGLRTHILVCMGTAFFVLVPQLAGYNEESLARVIQGIAAGIGFLGAGTILKQSEEGRIHGLTTAASIWLTAALGVAVGLGREASALAGAVFAFVVLHFLPRSPQSPEEG